jgi:hypothetical protein
MHRKRRISREKVRKAWDVPTAFSDVIFLGPITKKGVDEKERQNGTTHILFAF